MKKAILAVILGGATFLFSNAQKIKTADVPAQARQAFEKKFPGINGSWEKENANYEVNFKQESKSMSAVIDRAGSILEVETDISSGQLPAPAKQYLQKNYAGLKVAGTAKIEKANGEINFEAEVNHKDVIFDASGKFIREEKD